jgi:predicted kinase
MVARRLRAPYLRVDRIEQAVVDTGALRHPVGALGYAVAYALAEEQLWLDLDVVVECVNPIRLTRDTWRETAARAAARLVEVEMVCSDVDEHLRRVETRVSDVQRLVKPRWEQVVDREYEPWTRSRVVIDTSVTAPAAAADLITAQVTAARLGTRP